MKTVFSELTSAARLAGGFEVGGEVAGIVGSCLTARGIARAVGIGDGCLVHGRQGIVRAEVVGVSGGGAELLPFGTWDGVSVGDRVEALDHGGSIRPDASWQGRVIDALGRPLDGKGHLHEGPSARSVRAGPPPAFTRRRVGEKIATGVKSVDVFAPLCRGQRMGIFAGSGVGKSTLLAMLARECDADVVVLALVGERGREIRDFIEDDLGPEGLARSVLVVSTGDEPPLVRRRAAWTAMAVAEHFRDAGKHVLLLMDSVTRFAMAQREIGLAGREPPTAKGYPPTVFSELPRLLERAGPGDEGSGDITALFTVLVDGDDMSEPIADAVRGITDGHIVLDRRIAQRGRFPAVDLLASLSRLLPACHTEEEYAVMRAARQSLAMYADMEELIRLGAYRAGSDKAVDTAIAFAEPCEKFLYQTKGDAVLPSESFAQVRRLLAAANIAVEY